MKAFVGIFIVLATIAASSFVAASADPNYYAPPPPPVPVAKIQLGTLLKKSITIVAQQIVQFLSKQITALVPGSTEGKLICFKCAEIIQSWQNITVYFVFSTLVPLAPLVAALKTLKSANVEIVLATVGNLLGKNLAPILAVLPTIVAKLTIKIPNLLAFLISNLPPNCTTVALATLLSLLGAYIVQLAVTVLVTVLNSLC